VQRAPVGGTVILDGNGDGLVDAAGAGVIDGQAPVVYAASLAGDRSMLDRLLDSDSTIVLTDSNRRRVERWRSTRNTSGITLRADEDPAADNGKDGGEAQLALFPDAGPEWQTVATPRGARVSATRYGNPLWFEAGSRPAAALDGDPGTAWLVGPTIGGLGDRLTVDLDAPLSTNQVTVAASTLETMVTEVDLRFDGGAPVRASLGPASRTPAGQVVTFPTRRFSSVSVELVASAPSAPGAPESSIGIAELGIARPGGLPVTVDPLVRLPSALTDTLGPASSALPLSVVVTRERGDVTNPALFQEEASIARAFTLPTRRSFSLSGQARSRDAGLFDPVGCRADLVTVDGRPVPVRAVPAPGSDPDVLSVRSCEPISLGAGEHELRTSGATGTDVDQLALASAAGGGAAPLGFDGRPSPPAPAQSRPEVRWRQASNTAVDVETEATDGASWLILDQSHNDGWQASVEGGSELGSPVLVNGFANGYLVPADQAGALLIRPLWGVALAVLVVAGGSRRHGRGILAAAMVSVMALATASVVLGRVRRRHIRPFDFFTSLHWQHRLALLALLILLADLALNRLRPSAPVVDPVAGWRRWRAEGAMVTYSGREPLDPAAPGSRRRFLAACAAGGTLATGAFAWLLTAGPRQLLESTTSSGFYDAQAHSFLDGRLDVPAQVLGIEGFRSGTKTYEYQGPFPALIRMPVAAVTDRFDGRLTGISMLVGFVVAVVAASALLWQVRRLVRGSAGVGRVEAVAAGALLFTSTGGSALLFQASQISVYQEGALWGAALALAAFSVLLRHLVEPRRFTLLAASLLGVCTMWTRPSLGLGVITGLGMLALGEVVAWLRPVGRLRSAGERLRPAGVPRRRTAMAAVLACLAPLILYSAVNAAKFGTLFSVPWRDQAYTELSSTRREFLDRNGDFMGLQFIPTTAVAYLRPDSFTVQSHFPWVGYRTSSLGRAGYRGVTFDKIDTTGSIPTSFPLLVALGALGLAGVAGAWRRHGRLAMLAGPLAGTVVAASVIFPYGFIAHRYLTDVLPLLVLAGAAGFSMAGQALPRWTTGRRRLVGGGLAVVGAFGVWITVGQSLWYEAVYASPNQPAVTARFLEAQLDGGRLPFGQGFRVDQGPRLPRTGAAGQLFVVGDCTGLYISDGSVPDEFNPSNWKPVARSPQVGTYDLDATFPDAAAGESDRLLVSRDDAGGVLRVTYGGDGTVRFGYDGSGLPGQSEPVAVVPGRRYHLELTADPGTGMLTVHLDGKRAYSTLYLAADVPTLGADDLAVSSRPASDELCRRILASGS
jgi:hypothetical protein